MVDILLPRKLRIAERKLISNKHLELDLYTLPGAPTNPDLEKADVFSMESDTTLDNLPIKTGAKLIESRSCSRSKSSCNPKLWVGGELKQSHQFSAKTRALYVLLAYSTRLQSKCSRL